MSEATSIVTEVTAEKPHLLYKCVFAYWMLSFDEATMSQLKGKALKQIASFLLSEVKAERVVRLSLIVLENFLNCKALTEDFANCQILDAVQALEYEKWRDEELYSKIREISQAVAVKVSEVSNFDQYKKELDDALTTGLKRGPLHSAKFWAENCSKLDKSIVTKLKEIVELKRRDDDDDKEQTWSTTIAVACSDLGEIAVLHKDGKEWIKEAKAQDAVMKRLEGHENKIVRREALLCCQKLLHSYCCWQFLVSICAFQNAFQLFQEYLQRGTSLTMSDCPILRTQHGLEFVSNRTQLLVKCKDLCWSGCCNSRFLFHCRTRACKERTPTAKCTKKLQGLS